MLILQGNPAGRTLMRQIRLVLERSFNVRRHVRDNRIGNRVFRLSPIPLRDSCGNLYIASFLAPIFPSRQDRPRSRGLDVVDVRSHRSGDITKDEHTRRSRVPGSDLRCISGARTMVLGRWISTATDACCGQMTPNPAPQSDAREAARFGQPSQSRAVGRERSAAGEAYGL